MKVTKDGKLSLSPTDLTRFFESEFGSWMDRYYETSLKTGPLSHVHKNPPDPLQSLLAEKGNAHESDVLVSIEERGEVVRVDRTEGEETSVRIEKTLEAMRAGKSFIYQAALKGDTFFGYADLLRRVPGKSKFGDYLYEPLDMKIALSPKPTALLQLCAYADALLSIQGCLPKTLTVITRDGVHHEFKTECFFWFYRSFKKKFLEFHAAFDPACQPLPRKGDEHREWSIYAKRVLHERDDIQLTARIRQTHVTLLRTAGISTLTALAGIASDFRVPGINEDVLLTLKRQASLQLRSRQEGKVLFEVLDHPAETRVGLAMLPDPDPNDLFFDMEGYPLIGKNGLEYLYGVACRGDGRTKYLEFWAKSTSEEGNAFRSFMEFAHRLWQDNPKIHIYHYGHYEPSTLKRLMGQYGVCERIMDDLLRNDVFVDLYQVVVQGVRVGTHSYGLKAVEKLYYPERETEVSSGAESAIEFSNFLATGDQRFLERIRAYNQDDCFSAKDLEAFLRKLKDERSIAYVPLQTDEEIDRDVDSDSIREMCSRRAEELLSGVPPERRGLCIEQADPADYVQELLAHMLDFHRREDNPEWWEYFRRKDLSAEQLFDDPSVLAAVRIVEAKSDGSFVCAFDQRQDARFKVGDEVLILENNAPFEKLEIVEWDILGGRLTLQGSPSAVPTASFTLAPAKSNIRKDALLKSLLDQANHFDRSANHFGLRDSVFDLLLRKCPRINGTKPNDPLLAKGEDVVKGITRVVSNMAGGCLCVQGPPGTGKTYTASHVIVSLLKQGKTVAISSNSHKAITNLLKKVDALCGADRSICRPVKLTSGTRVAEETEEYSDSKVPVKSSSTSANVLFGASKKPTHAEGPVNLLGATAFYLCKEEHIDRFDYLFVDEATQVCLPNLVGMARCASNIILMGDQMQLDQPTQATHPGDSGRSGLVHMTGGKTVIDPSEGVFLPTTYRMHSGVNSIVSELFYSGSLQSHADNEAQEILWHDKCDLNLPRNGIHFLATPHIGNTHGSEEEALAIKAIVDSALNSSWRDKKGNVNRFTAEDILVVSPYNYQVSLLRKHLGGEARIGSVDLFQGQEAPLVLLSLCASTPQDAPRGISFLLNRNRVNVALSRAQSLAVVVGCPELAAGKPTTTDGLELMNVICRLCTTEWQK